MSSEGLKRLRVWADAKNLVVKIYREVIDILPPEEKYAMNQQLRRAAQSIPANIAEGYGRYYFQENIRFCYIARGSLEETLTYLILANELGYISYLKQSKHGKKDQTEQGVLKENRETYEMNGPFEIEEQQFE